MERITVIDGEDTTPILLVAPHGADDPRTGLLTKLIAEKTGAFAVINNGWERAKNYDYDKDRANCNNIEHCHEDVVKQEFLNPIMEYVNTIFDCSADITILIMHGVSDALNAKRDPSLDAVVGFGEGTPPSYTCDVVRKDAFIYILNQIMEVGQGEGGGRYAGRRRKNLNQLYRKWYADSQVHSLQIEVVRSLRCDDATTHMASDLFSQAIIEYVDFITSAEIPKEFKSDWQDYARSVPLV
jgi:hypothetical protein